MKKLTQISVLLLGLMVAFTGCDAAKEAANDAKGKAADMAKIDFGGFDMKGLQGKFTGITDGFKDVTAGQCRWIDIEDFRSRRLARRHGNRQTASASEVLCWWRDFEIQRLYQVGHGRHL